MTTSNKNLPPKPKEGEDVVPDSDAKLNEVQKEQLGDMLSEFVPAHLASDDDKEIAEAEKVVKELMNQGEKDGKEGSDTGTGEGLGEQSSDDDDGDSTIPSEDEGEGSQSVGDPEPASGGSEDGTSDAGGSEADDDPYTAYGLDPSLVADEETADQKHIRLLEERLAKLEAGGVQQKSKVEEQEPDTVFFTPEEAQLAITDPDKFAELLNTNLNKATTKARTEALREVPKAYAAQQKRETHIQKLTDTFWERNPNLVTHDKHVARIADELEGKNPDWQLERIFAETEKQAYKEIKVERRAKQTEKKRLKKDAHFPSGNGNSRPGNADTEEDKTGIAAEIRDLM